MAITKNEKIAIIVGVIILVLILVGLLIYLIRKHDENKNLAPGPSSSSNGAPSGSPSSSSNPPQSSSNSNPPPHHHRPPASPAGPISTGTPQLNSTSNPSLTQGSTLTGNGYDLTMQSDGNLVVYQGSTAIWASGTAGSGTAPYEATMTTDGYLSVYDSSGDDIWDSEVSGTGSAPYQASVDGTGALCVTYDSGSTQMWCSTPGSMTGAGALVTPS